MLTSDDLVLCAGSALQTPFTERLRLAPDAGFAGLSMWESDYLGARAEGYSEADLRGALADHGIEIAELDALTRWLPGEDGAVPSDWTTSFEEKDFYSRRRHRGPVDQRGRTRRAADDSARGGG